MSFRDILLLNCPSGELNVARLANSTCYRLESFLDMLIPLTSDVLNLFSIGHYLRHSLSNDVSDNHQI